MVYDFNEFGQSQTGSFNLYYDAEAAGLKAKELSPGLTLGYHGLSLGGMWICRVLSKEIPPLEFVILESAATTLPEFWQHYPMAHKILRFAFSLCPNKRSTLNPSTISANYGR